MRFWKENKKWIVAHAATWCVAKVLFVSIRLWAIGGSLQTALMMGSSEALLRQMFPLMALHVHTGVLLAAVAVTGLLDGLIFGWLDIRFDERFRHMRFLWRVLTKTCINLILALALTVVLVPVLMGKPGDIAAWPLLLMKANVMVIAGYVLVITFALQLVKLATAWIQTSDLVHILSTQTKGVEEDRIFMFVDMKGSTTHAETLGPARYSALIQDCFADMTKATKQTGAEIYQYIGDEAVFTWKTSPANVVHAVRHYFCFRDQLFHRANYYRRQYGIIPEFKAGIHHGQVMRTPIGGTRKTLAYHGDAINTASRIQGQCNALGRDLLVSGEIMGSMMTSCRYTDLGEHALRGKDRKVRIYSIEKAPTVPPVNSTLARQKVTPAKMKTSPFFLWLNTL